VSVKIPAFSILLFSLALVLLQRPLVNLTRYVPGTGQNVSTNDLNIGSQRWEYWRSCVAMKLLKMTDGHLFTLQNSNNTTQNMKGKNIHKEEW